MKKILGLALLAGTLATGNVWAVQCIGGAPVAFTVSGVFADSTLLGGSLDINTSCGTVTGGDIDIGNTSITNITNDGGYDGNEAWSGINFSQNIGGVTYSGMLAIDLSQQTNTSSLVGYSGGNLCFEISGEPPTGNCSNGEGGFVVSDYATTINNTENDPNLTSGTLSDSPEPASFFMLAGPVLWFGLRRLRAAQQ